LRKEEGRNGNGEAILDLQCSDVPPVGLEVQGLQKPRTRKERADTPLARTRDPIIIEAMLRTDPGPVKVRRSAATAILSSRRANKGEGSY